MTRRVQILINKYFDKDLWTLSETYGKRWVSAQVKNALSYYVTGDALRQRIPKKQPQTISPDDKQGFYIRIWLYNRDDDDINAFLDQMPTQYVTQLIKLIVRNFLYSDILQAYQLPLSAWNPNQGILAPSFEEKEEKKKETTVEQKEEEKINVVPFIQKKEEKEQQPESTGNEAVMLASLFSGLKNM